MLTLYLSKASSAVAPHILLEELGLPYTTQDVSIPKGDLQSDAFLAVNPKARVPVLVTEDGALTENPAILEYLACLKLEAGLQPVGVMAQARARELCAYLCATVHIAFAHKLRGARWTDDPEAQAALKLKVPDNIADAARYLEGSLPLAPWALGAQYSFCDPYLFLIGRWLAANDLALADYPKLARHQSEMRARPATQRVLVAHGLS